MSGSFFYFYNVPTVHVLHLDPFHTIIHYACSSEIEMNET